MTYDPLAATNAELRAEGERRIAARRAEEREASELKFKLADRVAELQIQVERLTAENRRLRGVSVAYVRAMHESKGGSQ